jgi:hypothetical protein
MLGLEVDAGVARELAAHRFAVRRHGIAAIGVDDVAATTAGDRVDGPVVCGDSISARTAGEPVATRPSVDQVSGAASGEPVIAAKTVELVRARGPDQPIGAGGPDDDCSAREPDHRQPDCGCQRRGQDATHEASLRLAHACVHGLSGDS